MRIFFLLCFREKAEKYYVYNVFPFILIFLFVMDTFGFKDIHKFDPQFLSDLVQKM